ncbi:helix-hairpin-helix domain-containing protein [Parabacteroides sp. PF5-9]|uniref:helix-hairpin-helix domain-containing protein n=1 Tax=Parabacteroides sp. PF5-9 TaxID=1742404 RepID=UPI0024761894|nr:helix-hairpin-helix domain-containing protein [Parabacteroides sp. PF5-9]MDH6356198.1 hypothetical protein [Parabacteroides sp. PF5-9]
MKRYYSILFINLLITCYFIHAQTYLSVDKWMEFIDELAEETGDTERAALLFTELSYLRDHPFDINTVSVDQLKKLPFLADNQINAIINYRERHGLLVTLYELKNIMELDQQTIAYILPFVFVSEQDVDKPVFTVDNLLRYGRNELQIRYDQSFQQKKGYSSLPDTILQQYPNRKYLGEPFYHSLRYEYTFDDHLQIGFVGEKDEGEPFWNKHHKGYDYHSAHLFLKDITWLKSLAVGDYKTSFGQGLVVSHDFTPGRSAVVTQAERRTNGFRRHFSTNESDYLRGMAITVQEKNVALSLFYSYRKMDAQVDSIRFTTIQTDGMHRLARERDKMRKVRMHTLGGNIHYSTPHVHIGLTALSYSFGDYEISPDPKPYNLFYFRGNRNMNASIDYVLKNRFIKFYGETAVSQNRALATLNALQLTPASYISCLILYRYYDRKYQAYFGNAFSQGSSVQNEEGVYVGLQFVPFIYWKWSGYIDLFRFPWLKYGVDAPSSGKEYMAQVDYTRDDSFSVYIRYKFRQKEKNSSLDEETSVSILPDKQHRMRLQATYRFIPALYFKTSVDGILYKTDQEENKGIMIAQSLGWKPEGIPFQIDCYGAWFHTDNYYTRISSYERHILYAFHKPSFYGKGVRLSASFRWDIVERLTLSAKVGYTHYTDRDRIGAGLEEIEGDEKTDLYALLRWKF